MMTIEIFKLIVDHTNPVADVITLILLMQLWITPFSELLTLYSSIKSQSRELKFIVCLVPGIFIVAFGIVAPLLFGAFVGGGTKPQALAAIAEIAVSQQFLLELAAVTVVFGLLVAWYCLIFRPRWLGLLITFGIEAATVVFWMVAAGGLLIEGFPLSLSALAQQKLPLLPYLIYGYFTILYKTLLTLLCVIVGIVFKDRVRNDTTDREYFLAGGNYEAAAIQFLNYRKKTTTCMLVLSLAFLFGLLTYLLFDDMGLTLQLSSFQQLPNDMVLVLLLPIVLMLVCMVHVLFAFAPRLLPAFRKLKRQDKLKLFYDEVVAKHPHPPSSGALETDHFVIQQVFVVCMVTIKANRIN